MEISELKIVRIDEIANKHYEWIKSFGWEKGSLLKKLAMIISEFGEAVDECRGEEIGEDYYYEIADVGLRVLTALKQVDIRLRASVLIEMRCEKLSASDLFLDEELDKMEYVGVLSTLIAPAIQECVFKKSKMLIVDQLMKCLIACYIHVGRDGYNLEDLMLAKIEKNLKRGSKGRVI